MQGHPEEKKQTVIEEATQTHFSERRKEPRLQIRRTQDILGDIAANFPK